ncbi:hypothetical protein L227DRAFT_20106 [Lentinus tigrinus ALCF2SS1-6]|uniref:C2H2-type domain-containing protein n=1 Tax=Lentinus tigrinus ALCF2SS1-6 TaxID=1328759 RepID=A0A5C2SX74_9APHY|nr:hypothetical protein L227DRAFT_20106 [Lentinus tigrinus ALCF2SS1-6]
MGYPRCRGCGGTTLVAAATVASSCVIGFTAVPSQFPRAAIRRELRVMGPHLFSLVRRAASISTSVHRGMCAGRCGFFLTAKRALLTVYERSVRDPERFICGDKIRGSNCPQLVKLEDAQEHLRVVHNQYFPYFVCNICGWRFKELARYARHEWVHIVDAPCIECSRKFRNANDRFAHLCERHGLTPENS